MRRARPGPATARPVHYSRRCSAPTTTFTRPTLSGMPATSRNWRCPRRATLLPSPRQSGPGEPVARLLVGGETTARGCWVSPRTAITAKSRARPGQRGRSAPSNRASVRDAFPRDRRPRRRGHPAEPARAAPVPETCPCLPTSFARWPVTRRNCSTRMWRCRRPRGIRARSSKVVTPPPRHQAVQPHGKTCWAPRTRCGAGGIHRNKDLTHACGRSCSPVP